MFSEKKTQPTRGQWPLVGEQHLLPLPQGKLSTINLEKPICNPFDMFGPETFTTNLEATSPLISGFFNPSNIHLFKTEQGSIRLWCKYMIYDIHTYYLCIFCVYEFTVYIFIYIYICTYDLYTLTF